MQSMLAQKFAAALPYERFLASIEPGHRGAWDMRHGQLELDLRQQAMLESFTRPLNVLCLTGPWCGDCALQGAALQRVAEMSQGLIDLRFIPRTDEHAELIVASQINAGFRVPVTWILDEQHEPLIRFGDRTLSRYRSMARKALGEHSNVIAPPPEDPVREVLREMLDEIERAQLMVLVP